MLFFRARFFCIFYAFLTMVETSTLQVETLISLFHSLPYTPLPPSNTPLPNAPPAQMMLSLPMVEPQRAQTVPVMQHHNYMAGTLGDHVHPGFQHQSFPNPIDPFNAHFQGLHSTGDHIQVTQEPYPRYVVPSIFSLLLGLIFR